MATLRARDEDQKLARKHTLMDAGWSLFRESDGNLPSVAQVVKKAGLAKGTFYLYFKTKEELFLVLLSDVFLSPKGSIFFVKSLWFISDNLRAIDDRVQGYIFIGVLLVLGTNILWCPFCLIFLFVL